MTDLSLGKLVLGNAPARDAIHIAVALVRTTAEMQPGQWGRLVDGSIGDIEPCEWHDSRCIGVVDPYITEPIPVGAQCYIFLRPNTVTGLRHVWQHPAFNDDIDKANAMAWIREFAGSIDQTYHRLMSAAEDHADADGEEWEYDNTEAYKRASGADWDLFWRHWTIVTGKNAPKDRSAPFTCSC